jgi:cell division septation protein DedD
VAIAFGSTQTSRVAICETPAGGYEYRGVRVRDGAKLIIPASRSDDGAFVADNDGVTYTVTAKSLLVSSGGQVISNEPMVYFGEPQTPASPTETSTPAPPPTTTTPATPLPPPLPAEEGGSG